MLLDGRRIIYIEDDPRNLKLVEILLSAEGAVVFNDRWGMPSLAMSFVMDHMPLDVILVDLMFSHGYSGYDIFKSIRKQSVLDSVPVVIISAADPYTEMPKALKVGLSGYIAKPLDATRFAQQVLDVIIGKPVWYAD